MRAVPGALLFVFALAILAGVPGAQGAEIAPSFTLVDTEGVTVSSAGLRGQVVVLDFFSTQCAPCQIVEEKLQELHPTYGADVVFLTVGVWPVDTPDVLRAYRAEKDVPWQLATDTDGMVSKFGVATIPNLQIIDASGFLVWEWYATFGWSPDRMKADLAVALDQALGGGLLPRTVASLSIPLLLIVAALLSFFSPCSFPVLPAYMAYYLKLDARDGQGTVRTAVGRGFFASLGMVAVYLVLVAVVVAALAVTQAAFAPPLGSLSLVVGIVLVVLGVATFRTAPFQVLTRPFRVLGERLARAIGTRWSPGLRAKLFAFGIGYGAAGFACVAPPFFGAVLNAAAFGSPEEVLFGLVLYVLIVIALMVGITVTLQAAGERALRRMKAWSRVIQLASAIALVLAGSYLLFVFANAYVG